MIERMESSYYGRVHSPYIRVDDEAKKRRYRFIKSYENFVLLERIDIGVKECFSHLEVNQLEVI